MTLLRTSQLFWREKFVKVVISALQEPLTPTKPTDFSGNWVGPQQHSATLQAVRIYS